MEFSRRKLPGEAALNLRLCPVASVKPYALMLSPVYVFMRLNEKFVSVKGPLDFFTPEELERMKPFDSFFLPDFVDSVLPFRKAARQVRALISWAPQKDGEERVSPPPYVISDAVLQMVAPLWGPDAVIEPFFAAIFTNELCDALPVPMLIASRERDVAIYENAILRSGWSVFLALHLGYHELSFLNRLRLRVFESALALTPVSSIGIASEVDELVEIVFSCMGDGGPSGRDLRQAVRGEVFSAHRGRAAQKMVKRLERVRGMISTNRLLPTIFGERGFVDE